MRIGFVADYLNSEYSECLISGITTCCKEHNVDLVIYQIGKIKPADATGHDYQYMAISSQINEHNVDGIIISSGTQLPEWLHRATLVSSPPCYKASRASTPRGLAAR